MRVVFSPGSKAARPASQRSEKRSVRLVVHASGRGACRTGHLGERVCGSSANRAGRDSAKPNCSDSLRLGRSGWQGQLLGGEFVGELSRPAAQPKRRVSDWNGLRCEADQFRGGASRQVQSPQRKLIVLTPLVLRGARMKP